jgi:squalene-hopene/tetraprenyl-beta-curcumene cyclase
MHTLPFAAVPTPSRSESTSHQGLQRWQVARARSAAHIRAHLTTVPRPGVGVFARSQVKGRLFETALTLHLLRREGVEPGWQQRLRACLEEQLDEAEPFGRLVASSVLGREPDTSARAALDELLRTLRYGKDRKRHLLQVLLLELGVLTEAPEVLEALPATHPSWHFFSRIYASACRLILYRRQGRRVEEMPEALFLRAAQGANGGWEQQALLTLVALLGLGREQPECFERGLRFLEYLSRPDDSIPFIDNLHLWVTALSGLALSESQGAPLSALRDMGDYLLSHQSPEGGWGFTEQVVQSDTDTTAHCLLLLQEVGEPHHAGAIARGHRYLLALQRQDGGYPTYVSAGDSEVTMTACVLQAQARQFHHAAHLREPMLRALSYLVDSQRPDGAFEQSWSLCETYSLFRVLWALEDCLPLATEWQGESLRQGALRYLLTHQHEDGSWGQTPGEPGDVLSTAYAISALCLLGHRERLSGAVRYLLSRQSPNGAFLSRPDQSGPRPLVYEEPLLGSIFSLIALNRAHRLLAWSSSGAVVRKTA